MVYWDPTSFPSYSEVCAQCALTTGDCSDLCEDNYLVEPTHSDELPYVGWFNTFAFLVEDKQVYPDIGPLGWVDSSFGNGDISACSVQRAGEWLLNWQEPDAHTEDVWSEVFTETSSYRGLIRSIVTSPQYWRGVQ